METIDHIEAIYLKSVTDKLDSNNYNKIFDKAFNFHCEKHYSL